MKNRYNYMTPSEVIDETTGDVFPDPLSLDYHSISLTIKPESIELGEHNIIMLWREVARLYGIAELDDIVLTLNSIPHKNFLKEGDTLYIPAKVDIEQSFEK